VPDDKHPPVIDEHLARRLVDRQFPQWAGLPTRGWALWKALIMLVEHLDRDPGAAAAQRRVIERVLADHAREA
jgi:hypothetical protein